MGHSDYNLLPSCRSEQTCYFSTSHSSSSHIARETTTSYPSPTIFPETPSDPSNPLLALREPSYSSRLPSWAMDASKLLQLQTAAAYSRPDAQSRQKSTASNSSTGSNNSSSSNLPQSPPVICCARCRRDSAAGEMINIGTNQYYCRHCASMVGYNSG